jgi:drug/metabolite transporter (DMT)-like permease
VSLNFIYFIGMCLIGGLNWWPVKAATAEVPPIFLAGVRFSLAGSGFVIWALAAGHTLRAGRAGRLAATALLMITGCFALVFWGTKHAPSGLAAVVNLALMPIMMIGFGALHGQETVTRRRLAAVAAGVAGLVLLFLPRIGAGGPTDAPALMGLLAVVAGTAAYAWGAVLSRPVLAGMAPVAVAAWQQGIGGAALLALSAAIEPVDAATPQAFLQAPAGPALAFMTIVSSIVGFTIYLKLLRDWGPFRSGLYAFVSPVIAVGVGVAVLGESFGPWEAAGAAVLMGATALALTGRR